MELPRLELKRTEQLVLVVRQVVLLCHNQRLMQLQHPLFFGY
jgi:hypothetical protein